MKPIKFRAWDKENKKMFKVQNLDFGSKGTYLGAVDETLTFRVPEDIIVMQYTGLKDKHKKEIYEGDILQRWNNVQKIWENKIIVYSIEDFYFDESHEFNLWGGNEEYQIRGNIYKNPELLENKNERD